MEIDEKIEKKKETRPKLYKDMYYRLILPGTVFTIGVLLLIGVGSLEFYKKDER